MRFFGIHIVNKSLIMTSSSVSVWLLGINTFKKKKLQRHLCEKDDSSKWNMNKDDNIRENETNLKKKTLNCFFI